MAISKHQLCTHVYQQCSFSPYLVVDALRFFVVFLQPNPGQSWCAVNTSTDGMINVKRNKTCEDPDCTKYPVYGNQGGPRRCCRKHAKPGMTNLIRKTCAVQECSKTPNYEKYCRLHFEEQLMRTAEQKEAGEEGTREVEQSARTPLDGSMIEAARAAYSAAVVTAEGGWHPPDSPAQPPAAATERRGQCSGEGVNQPEPVPPSAVTSFTAHLLATPKPVAASPAMGECEGDAGGVSADVNGLISLFSAACVRGEGQGAVADAGAQGDGTWSKAPETVSAVVVGTGQRIPVPAPHSGCDGDDTVVQLADSFAGLTTAATRTEQGVTAAPASVEVVPFDGLRVMADVAAAETAAAPATLQRISSNCDSGGRCAGGGVNLAGHAEEVGSWPQTPPPHPILCGKMVDR